MTRLLASLSLVAVAPFVAHAKVYDKTVEIGGIPVHYKLVLPKDYDAEKSYPAILAFPPGPQTADMVLTTLERNWRPEAERRGYIVIVPAAPRGQLFYEEGSKVFPEFLDRLLSEHKIRDGKFHVAGMSNGGISAFHIAAEYPKYFLSVTGLPGYLPDATPQRVAALAGMCISMFVGEADPGFGGTMQKQAAEFRSKGYKVRFTVEPGQPHVMATLAGPGAARLFDQIEKGCGK